VTQRENEGREMKEVICKRVSRDLGRGPLSGYGSGVRCIAGICPKLVALSGRTSAAFHEHRQLSSYNFEKENGRGLIAERAGDME
jgi:hypothetical protein